MADSSVVAQLDKAVTNVVRKAVFFNAHHAGHFNPTVELVKIMVDGGVEVHYFASADLKSRIEDAGALFHNYGSDSWSLRDCSIEATLALGCTPSDELNNEFLFHQTLVATVHLLPYLLEEIRKIKPCVCVSDSGYPWGHLAARILGIPAISSCSSTMMPPAEKEAVCGNLRTVDFIMKAVGLLAERYDISYDAVDSYCNYSGFTISWCNPKFLATEVSQMDPRCRFFGASQPIPSSDTDVVVAAAVAQLTRDADSFPLAELKKKADAGERVIYVSMGTVVGTEPWTMGMLGSFYQNVFDAFGGDVHTTVVVSIGKHLKPTDLPSTTPANYIIRASVPQTALLRVATLFVTHNGMNSTNEAMFASVPMVCMPAFADQNFNATRIEQLGMGTHIKSPFAPAPAQNFDHLTATAIRGAAALIFADYARFKSNCDLMRDDMIEQCKYLHTQALADISEWVQMEQTSLSAAEE